MRQIENPIVIYKQVTKAYGDLNVLKKIDFKIYPGEKVVLIGSSGSGKTTLMRLLMMLEEPTGGEIYVEGERIFPAIHHSENKKVHQIKNDIGMVFQQFNLFPHMTILENIMEAPVHVKKEPKAQARAYALELLEKVGLSDKADAYLSQLSGGQTQRVAIARALAMRPKILLFDEPTSALDPELVGEVLKVIKEIAQDGSTTMLLVTHEMKFARDVADRVCFFDKGVISEQGSPQEFFENPKTERLKQFLNRFLHTGKDEEYENA